MTLQEKLNLLRMKGVPLPLVGMQEVTQAMNLRRTGMTYRTISTVMRLYHGSDKSENTWRNLLKAQGAPPKHHANGVRRVPPQLRAPKS